jgi:hypothetical protein
MADIKSMCWIIPASIDMEEILKKDPPEFKHKVDYFYYIIDTITEASDLEDLDNNAGFVNLQAKRLQAFNHNYGKYIDYLLGKVIRRDGYVVGKKSFGYCINIRNEDGGLKAVPIIDFIARKNLKQEYAEKKKNSGIKGKKYDYLTKWFNPQLKIDGEKAREKVNELFPPLTGAIRGTKKGQPSRTTKRYKSLVAIEKFEKQEFYNSVDGNIGRFHSNIANIKKELRQFITYNEQQLVNVDIKNSQPLFSTLLLSEAFYNILSKPINIYNIPSVLPYININITNINKTISIIDHYIMIVESSESVNNKGFQKYIDLVNSDDFYRRMASIIAPNKPYVKAEMKTMMFMVFFSSNRFIGQPQAQFKRLFRAHFPEVYEVFRMIKKGNHAALSHLLQRIESNIIVELASRRIAEERPEVPIFTVHDSIATTVGNEEYIEAVIEEEIFGYTGLKVKLGREYWTD